MSLFDKIVSKVEDSYEPSLESYLEHDSDEDTDDTVIEAMEAMGVPTTVKNDPKSTEDLPLAEIEALRKDGAAEEDEDDGLADETVEELLAGYIDEEYAEAEDAVDELSDSDLDAIDDDFDDV